MSPLTLRRIGIFKKNKMAMFSLAMLLFLFVLSCLAELIANHKPYYLRYRGQHFFPILKRPSAEALGLENNFSINYRELKLEADDFVLFPPVHFNPYESNKKLATYPAPPNSENWFGTDDRGRDIFTRLLYGFRISLFFALGVWVLTYALGVAAGLAMGYFGGKWDFFGQRAVEILNATPQFFLLIILISIFGATMPLLIAISAIFGWISISYYVRAEALKLRNLEFVEAARSLGLSTPRILFKHVLLNSLTPIITFAPFAIAGGVASLAALDYLGFGLPPPTPSWGELLNQARKYFTTAWWLAFFPSCALFFTLMFLIFVGEGLREAFDPKAQT